MDKIQEEIDELAQDAKAFLDHIDELEGAIAWCISRNALINFGRTEVLVSGGVSENYTAPTFLDAVFLAREKEAEKLLEGTGI